MPSSSTKLSLGIFPCASVFQEFLFGPSPPRRPLTAFLELNTAKQQLYIPAKQGNRRKSWQAVVCP
jgi:hypothetical protein